MGKLIEFSIGFTNIDHAVFTPGQALCGNVVVNLRDSMNLKALKVNFKGKANVQWSEREGSGENATTRYYRATERYFDTTKSLVGQGSGGSTENTSQLLAGRNAYPFTFQLPSNLPSSFEGKTGYVRYSVEATIEKPRKFNHKTKVAFNVLNPLDLNRDPSSKYQVHGNNSKTLCCWCCTSAPIQVDVHLDRRGYVPGEFIFVNANVDNLSSRRMRSTRAELVQTVKFHASGKTVSLDKIVSSVTGEGCGPRRSISWNNKQLQFVVVVPLGSYNLKTSVPIIIGSVPLMDFSRFNHPVPQSQTVPPTAPSASQFGGVASLQPPPPTYAAAVEGPVNIKDEESNDHVMD